MPETKSKIIQYAKVLDNFAENDKGKEEFIGQVGRVLKIECDYYMFSQVKLRFRNRKVRWFSNTTLEEVDKNGKKFVANDYQI